MEPDPTYEKVRRWATLVLTLATFAVAVYMALRSGQPLPPVPPLPSQPAIQVVADDRPPPNATGWVNDPDAVRETVATMPRPKFEETPAGKSADPLPKQAYLWQAYVKLYGTNPPVQDQNPIGSCVSFGSARAFERSLAVQIMQGDPFKFRHVVEEVIYGGSRVEIGGGRIRGDGSVGAWAAKFLTQYGAPPRGVYGQYDLSKYSPNLCRAWGRTGVPDDFEAEVKKYPAGDCAMVTSADAAQRALAKGYGIFVCSDQGFTRQRDENGVCRASGSWAHCMCIDGYHTDDSGRVYFHIENSWGPDYHVGPVGWGDPNTGGFYAARDVVERMLRQGDSFAVSAVKGFPDRDLDWLVGLGRGVDFARKQGDGHEVPALRPVRGGARWALAW